MGVQVHTILQNAGEALRLDKKGYFLFDEEGRIERIDGKVLGHGNVWGAPMAMLQSLAEGTPYGLWRAGDGPLAQIGLPQIEEIRNRMVFEAGRGQPLAHVSIGNWRSVGQLGGGLVTVKGTPHQYDTLIPSTPNKDGFVPNKDITVFSTFENAINYAAVIYAVSGGISVGNRPLMTWQDYVAVSALESPALHQLSERIRQLTSDQVLQLTDRFMNLLPSEYVEKKDGDNIFLQPEQISGMWHGVLPEAVKSRMEEERAQGSKIPTPKLMNLVYVDISLNEVEILSRGSTREYDGPIPSFAEVKSAPGLYAILEFVQSLIQRAAIRNNFSKKVLFAAQGTLSGEKVEDRGQPRESYRRFYNNIRSSTQEIREIRSTDLQNARRFLDEEGKLLPFDVRRSNGIFGLTEVGFVPSGNVRRKMAAFQQELRTEFGDKLYFVKPRNLHLTFQGLERRWENQLKGVAREDLGHEGIDGIDRSDVRFAAAFDQADDIPSVAARVQVSGVNWNPEIGIFWEIQPVLRDGESDPIMARREGWDRPRPRPPHITAANFAKPFTQAELTHLREIINRHQTGLGEITFHQAQIVAYEDTTLEKYLVLHTTELKTKSPASSLGQASKQSGFLDLSVFSGIVQNKWARQVLAGILLGAFSPLAMAAPGMMTATLATFAAPFALVTLGAVALGGVGYFLYQKLARSLTEKPRTLNNLFNLKPLKANDFVPPISRQFQDLEISRRALIGAIGLTNELGESAIPDAGNNIVDRSVRVAILSGAASRENLAMPALQVLDRLKKYAEELVFGNKKWFVKSVDRINEVVAKSDSKLVEVDILDPGSVKAIHLDETSDSEMIKNTVSLLSKLRTEEGQVLLGTTGSGVVITLAPGMEVGPNRDAVQELIRLGAGLSILPVVVKTLGETDGIMTMEDSRMTLSLTKIVGLLNMKMNNVAKIQTVTSPTSTVQFDKNGIPESVLVEKILWLLNGIGLVISSESTENEIRSLIEALKAA